VSAPLLQNPEPLLASIDMKELLLMQSVCKFAKAWARLSGPRQQVGPEEG
jgi:hypothetical protein